MVGLAAGSLDRRIRIERDGPQVHDGLQLVPGPPVILGANAGKRWASIKPAGGQERYVNAETAALSRVVIRIRYTKALDPDRLGGLTASDRVRHPAADDGQIYDVIDAATMGAREWIEILATKRT